jgi:hypothetical protein
MGQCRAPGNAGAGQESAADINVIPGHVLQQVPSTSTQKIVRIRNPKLLAVVVFLLTEEPFMAYERNPDDPYRPNLAEGPASGTKVARFAIAIAVVLGAVFYGLNNSTINQAGTSSTAQNTTQSSPPAAPPGMRDLTPRANTDRGMTTGAAPARPQTPPATAPAEMNPPANNAPASK